MQKIQEEKPQAYASHFPIRVNDSSIEEGTMQFSVSVTEKLENIWGVAHGGMLATIFDTCMACAIRALCPVPSVKTIGLSIDYFRPVPIGCELEVEVRILQKGKTLASVDAQAWVCGKEKKLTNHALGKFYLA